MEFNSLGYFQFDNLVRGRIPFLLLNLGVDLSAWYNSVEAMHLNNYNVPVTPSNYIEQVKAKNLPPHFAIVVIDEDGTTAKEIAAALEASGFLNSYYVRGGIKGLAQERAENL